MGNGLFKSLLAVTALIAGGLAGYLYWERTALLQRAEESANKAQSVEQQLAAARGEAKASKEKAEELARLKQTHDDMMKSLQQEVAAGEVTISRLADRLSVKILDKILFPSGEAAVSAKGREVLGRVGKVLAKAHNKDRIIRIEGHTDNVPIGVHLKDKFPTNWELSTARATNVVRFLIESAKIPPNAFEAAGLGEFHPVAKNDTPQSRQQNRRIEIILYPRVQALAKELPKLKLAPAGEAKP